MKFAKTLLAVAALGAAFAAQAESNIASAPSGAISATARLTFNVVIPRVIYLRVGTGTDFTPNNTFDSVTFTALTGNIGTGTAIAGVPSAASVPGSVGVRVLSTGGAVNLSAAGSGTGMTAAGLDVIPWARISGATSNAALPNPTIGAAAVSLAATNGVVAQSANWNFNYANTDTLAAGTYTGVVTYTAALP
jgi:hypothetical protein